MSNLSFNEAGNSPLQRFLHQENEKDASRLDLTNYAPLLDADITVWDTVGDWIRRHQPLLVNLSMSSIQLDDQKTQRWVRRCFPFNEIHEKTDELGPCSWKSLDLSFNNLGQNTARLLARTVLIHNIPLQVLQLNSNSLGNTGVTTLSSTILEGDRIPTLQEISLAANRCDPAVVAPSLLTNRSLRKLDVSYNRMSYRGCVAFAEVLRTRRSGLQELSLAYCRIGPRGFSVLVEALAKEQHQLRELVLDCNELGNQGARGVARLISSPTNTIANLFLRRNGITGDGVVALAEALHNNTVVNSLVLTHNDLQETGERALDAVLQTNRVVSEMGTLTSSSSSPSSAMRLGRLHFQVACNKNGFWSLLESEDQLICWEVLVARLFGRTNAPRGLDLVFCLLRNRPDLVTRPY